MITDNFQQLSNIKKKYFSILAVLSIHWGTQAVNSTGSVVSAARSYQESACNAETLGTRVWSLGGEDPLEEEMAIYLNILAWKFPRTEECGVYSPWGRES